MSLKATVLIVSVLLLAPALGADTIYQTTAEGKEMVLQRDAIVVHEDSSFLEYKHFDLKERRIIKVTLNRGSTLAYMVKQSEAAERQQIVNKWKAFGFKATITSQAGKISHVADAYLDFYPPGGHGSLLESVAARTSFPVQLDQGGADEIDFSKISRVDIQGTHLVLTLRNGQSLGGKFMMPTTQPAEVRILGVTDQYDPASNDVFDFSAPLSQLKMISFE